ncbi:MAG TPA: hypothetical protein PKA63_00075 [Oligoflexia bacterium]|nr:hypothetical protein [Oligoflexia bacterium]HMP47044.1 hypothetical protein [Oligoflexia bacterium]
MKRHYKFHSISFNALLFVFFILLMSSCVSGSGSKDSSALSESRPAVLIASEGFENESFSEFWSYPSINQSSYHPHSRAVPFVTAPVRSGKFAAHYYLLAGTDERTPFQVAHTDFSAEEFYIEWHEFLANDYPRPVGQKMCRFTGPNLLEVDVINLDRNRNLQLFWYYDGREGFVNTARGLPLERWNKLGFWVKLNSLGKSDGFLRLYLDNNLIASLENQEIRSNSDSFETMWIGGNYTNQGPLSSSGSRFIDDISWYTTKP